MQNNYFGTRHGSVGNPQTSVTSLLPKLQNKESAQNLYSNPFTRTRNSSINVVDDRDQMGTSPMKGKTNQAQELLAYIANEVKRFVSTKRVNDANLMELD